MTYKLEILIREMSPGGVIRGEMAYDWKKIVGLSEQIFRITKSDPLWF